MALSKSSVADIAWVSQRTNVDHSNAVTQGSGGESSMSLSVSLYSTRRRLRPALVVDTQRRFTFTLVGSSALYVCLYGADSSSFAVQRRRTSF